ncbi:hypothetical protein MLD38_005656 [Melastoma candidum]|uniref:Uncharacterized protein n=1 Tax=Melastoma candidum TaxID=119954 RepID=A0ACB9RTS4_9MYRT|nr:hypothetical protein MLD38_005656 [Melastoma candidum]
MEKDASRESCLLNVSRHWFVILAFASFYLVAEFGCGRIGLKSGFGVMNDGLLPSSVSSTRSGSGVADRCAGRYVYMYRLPSKFNDDLLRNCRSLAKWFDMCPFAVNSGLGPGMEKKGWFATNQFMLEVIFRGRMEHYECLTNDSSMASAVFVPFYAGLDIGRHLWGFNASVRDSLENDLVEWLKRAPEWRKTRGVDHFLIGGRIGWDFRRGADDEAEWGGKLMTVAECRNMTMLTIESTFFDNDVAIPYPTYFHPTTRAEVTRWQNQMRKQKRRRLFSFVGGPRNDSIRIKLMDKCLDSGNRCLFFNCHDKASNCDDPSRVLKVHKNSIFCLQPPGDSDTRRSTFDSMLAGCIPVFFRRNSAYSQYFWHLPRNYSKYSIFIPEDEVLQNKVSVTETLLRIPSETVKEMREEVIKLIPGVIYADPRHDVEHGLEDAFDLAIKGVLNRIAIRQNDTSHL